MDTSLLPYGGREIENLRLDGKRPAHMVLVSLIGSLRVLNPVVTARPEKSYGWRFLSGLDVLIVANSSTEKSLVKRVIDSILTIKPDYLGLWLADRQNGQHVAWGSYRPKSKAMRWMSPHDRQSFEGVGYGNH